MRLLGLGLCLGLVLAGCLGSDRTFPDESTDTTDLRLNAYTDVHSDAPHSAILEISGAGADGGARAFRAQVQVELALQQKASDGSASYQDVKTWTLDLTPNDFSSPNVPLYKFAISASDLPAEGTYRANATATVAGRALNATALFAYVRTGVPAA